MAVRAARLRFELLLLLVPVLLFGPLVLAGRAFLPQLPLQVEPLRTEHPDAAAEAFQATNYPQIDRLFPFLTEQYAMRAALADGELPLWEPHLGIGVPLLGMSIAGVSYVPNWLGFLIPPERAAGPLAAFSLLLAGLGMALFLRRLGFSPGAVAVGVIGYQLGNWGLSNLFYFMKVDAALWAPWALWAIEGLHRGKRFSGWWLTVAIGASCVAGMISIGVFVLGLAGLYGLLRSFPGTRRWVDVEPEPEPAAAHSPRALAFVPYLVLGVLSAAVFLLPASEASAQSDRQPKTAEEIRAQSLPFKTLGGIAVVDLVGAPTDSTPAGSLPVAWALTPAEDVAKAENANQLEWNTFGGAAILLLALVGLIALPRKALLPAGLLVGVLGFAQGWPVLSWLYRVPGLDLGAPSRILALAWFLWPWLAALGTEAWIRNRPRAREALLGGSFLLAGVACVLWLRLDPETWASRLETGVLERFEAPIAGLAEAHGLTPLEVLRSRLPWEATVEAGDRIRTSLGLLLGASLGLLGAGLYGLVRRKASTSESPPSPARGLLPLLGVLLLLVVAPCWERAFDTSYGIAPVVLAAVGTALLGLLALLARGLAPEDAPWWLPLAVVVAAEGFVAANGHVTSLELEGSPFPASPALEDVRVAAGDERVIRIDTSASGVDDVYVLARPTLLLPYDVADLTPYIVFPPRLLNELFEALDPRTRWRQGISRLPDPSLLGHPILDLARVGAVLSREPLDHPRLEPVRESHGFHVYRRTGALPLARTVPEAVPAPSDDVGLLTLASGALDWSRHTLLPVRDLERASPGRPSDDPGRITRIDRPARGRVEISVEGSEGGWLVLHEQHYPGWRATVNGEPTDLFRADHVYQAVRIPPGSSEIVFRYAPGSVRWGFLLTVAALVGAALLSWRSAS